MIINAVTHHGQFHEDVDVYANTREEFANECANNLGYVTARNRYIMLLVWDKLLKNGKCSMGWTDFTVKA